MLFNNLNLARVYQDHLMDKIVWEKPATYMYMFFIYSMLLDGDL